MFGDELSYQVSFSEVYVIKRIGNEMPCVKQCGLLIRGGFGVTGFKEKYWRD